MLKIKVRLQQNPSKKENKITALRLFARMLTVLSMVNKNKSLLISFAVKLITHFYSSRKNKGSKQMLFLYQCIILSLESYCFANCQIFLFVWFCFVFNLRFTPADEQANTWKTTKSTLAVLVACMQLYFIQNLYLYHIKLFCFVCFRSVIIPDCLWCCQMFLLV